MMIKPKALHEGATIGIVSPASSIAQDRLDRGCQILRELGFRVNLGEGVLDRLKCYAGTDEARAKRLAAAFADPQIDGIVCAAGGVGCERLYPYLDFDAIRQNPKVFIGFSNITLLHLMLHRLCSLNSIYFLGLGEICSEDRADLDRPLRVLAKLVREPSLHMDLPLASAQPPVETLVGGRAVAPVTGGACVTASLGTPYEIDCKGHILALELGVDTVRWGIYLAQLQNAGKLADAVGFLLPPYDAGVKPGLAPSPTGDFPTKEDYVRDFIVPLGKPTLVNVPFGHASDPLPLPFGTAVELDVDERRVTICEGLVHA